MFTANSNFMYGDPRDRETLGARKQRKAAEREGSVKTNDSGENSASPPSTSSGPANRKPSVASAASSKEAKPPSTSSSSQKPKSRFGFFGSKSKEATHEKTPSISTSEGDGSAIPEQKISLTSLDTTVLQFPKPGGGNVYNHLTPPSSENDISRQPPMPPPSFPVPPTPEEGPHSARLRGFPSPSQRIASDFNLRPIADNYSSDDYYSASSPRSGRMGSTGSGQTTTESTGGRSMEPIDSIDEGIQSFYISEHENNYKFRRNTRNDPNLHQIQTQQRSSSGSASVSSPNSAGLPAYEAVGYPNHLPMDSKHPAIRSASRVAEKIPTPAGPGRSSFQAALAKMENAGLRIMFKRLSEDWGSSSQDSDNAMLEEVAFEQRLWALVAAEWLTFGKPLQSDAHEFLLDAHPQDGRRLLHLHGSAADGWVLAAKYPNVTVYSVSSQDISNPPSQWPAPLNHHALFLSRPDASLPFPDNYFDVISTKSFSSLLRNSDWVNVLRECNRVLRPNGWIELQIIDPVLTKQGELLRDWLEGRIIREMLEDNFAIKPSDDVMSHLHEAGFDNVKRSRIALPASFNPKTKNMARGQGPDPDAARVMVLVGRHFYEELYRGFNPIIHGHSNDFMWWQSKSIKHECEALNTCFGLTFAFGQKV